MIKTDLESAKKEEARPKLEITASAGSEESIPTIPIMITTDLGKTQQHVKYNTGRKYSTPQLSTVTSQEELVEHLKNIHVSTPVAASTSYYISGMQKRRASVDEAMIGRKVPISLPRQTADLTIPRSKSSSTRHPEASPSQFSESQGGFGSDKRITLYKTEMCRTFEETGTCKYGVKCQFAHDRAELRNIQRHPRYKTEICKTFWEQGNCPYGKRCCFIHTENEVLKAPNMKPTAIPNVTQPASPEKNRSKLFERLHTGEGISASLPASSAMNIFSMSHAHHYPSSTWAKNSYKDEPFLDFGVCGPVGSPTAQHPFSLGNLHSRNRLPSINDPLFESISIPSDGHSDTAWEEESIGLLPSDLINNHDY